MILCNLPATQCLAFIAFITSLFACQGHPPPTSSSVVPPLQTPAPAVLEKEREPNILPFPAHFSLTRSALLEFDGTVGLSEKKQQAQGLDFLPVLSSRFGCYSLGAQEPWSGGDSENCIFDRRFNNAETYTKGDFLLAVLYDESAFMRPVISVWKIRGDSLDFYAVLNKCFDPEGEGSEMQIDSIQPIAADKQRIWGQISWNGEDQQREVHSWSAVWTLPDKLDFR